MSLANIIYLVPALLIAVVVHEYSHGRVAEVLGDPTPRAAGRLTLNPIPHLDPFGSVLLPLVLIMMGSPIVFAAAKPMPINPMYFTHGRRDLVFVGLAGPVSNIVMAATVGLSASAIWGGLPEFAQQFAVWFVFINILLAMFNMIPIPPLDGSRVVEGFLPPRHIGTFHSIERYGILILFALLFFFNNVFRAVFEPALTFMVRLFLRGM